MSKVGVAVGEHEKEKVIFDIYEPFINPTEFADIANLLKEDKVFQAELFEKGAQFENAMDDAEAYERCIEALK